MGTQHKNGQSGIGGILNTLMVATGWSTGRSARKGDRLEPEEWARQKEDWMRSQEFLFLMYTMNRKINGW